MVAPLDYAFQPLCIGNIVGAYPLRDIDYARLRALLDRLRDVHKLDESQYQARIFWRDDAGTILLTGMWIKNGEAPYEDFFKHAWKEVPWPTMTRTN